MCDMENETLTKPVTFRLTEGMWEEIKRGSIEDIRKVPDEVRYLITLGLKAREAKT